MSRQTPRKARHQNNPGAGSAATVTNGHRRQQSRQQQQNGQGHLTVPLVSGSGPYASDGSAAVDAGGNGGVSDDDGELGVYRTRKGAEEMTLLALQRYDPTIECAELTAPNASTYVMDPESGRWERATELEGPLFLCTQKSADLEGQYEIPRACLFLLNRKNPTNLVVDLGLVKSMEVAGEMVSMQLEEGSRALASADSEKPTIVGLWMHRSHQDGDVNGNGDSGGGGDDDEVSQETAQSRSNRVVQTWQAIRSYLVGKLELDDAVQLIAVVASAAMMAQVKAMEVGRGPEGLATKAFGPQLDALDIMATCLEQSRGMGGQ